MGDNVRELTPIEKENAALKDMIDELEKELEKHKEAAQFFERQYNGEKARTETLMDKVEELKGAVVAQALCVAEHLENDERL